MPRLNIEEANNIKNVWARKLKAAIDRKEDGKALPIHRLRTLYITMENYEFEGYRQQDDEYPEP